MLPDRRNSIAFWKRPRLCKSVLEGTTCTGKWVRILGVMIFTGENRRTRNKNLSHCYFLHHKFRKGLVWGRNSASTTWRLNYSTLFVFNVVFLFNNVIYAFLLCLCIFIVCLGISSCQLAIFGYPDWGFSLLFPQL